jgi:voltage-gated potassium channel
LTLQTLQNKKFTVLLISFCVLLFGSIFIPQNMIKYAIPVLYVQNIIAGLLLFMHDRKTVFKILLLLVGIAIGLEVGSLFVDYHALRLSLPLVYISYFLLVSVELYRQVYKSKKVDTEIIAAVFCGFLMLGLLGSYAFILVETITPGSFGGITKDYMHVDLDLLYFSFITIMTIGYGDILPLTPIARKVTMIIGLAGHFYTVFVLAIIIGKFQSNKD